MVPRRVPADEQQWIAYKRPRWKSLLAQLILLRGATQLLTLRGPRAVRRGAAVHDLGIIEDGSVLIRDGIIAAVGSTRRIENLKEARAALEIPVNGKVVMPGFIDPSVNLSLNQGSGCARQSNKRHRLTEFYDQSLGLMRSCLQHGTLTAGVKAIADAGDFRSGIAVLRQLAKIGSNPVDMVRTWRIDSAPSPESFSLSDFREALAALAKRKLAHSVEVGIGFEPEASEPLLAAAKEAHLEIGLLWREGSPEVLASLLSRFKPRTVCCPARLTAAECLALANSPSIAVFAPAREVFDEPGASCARQLGDSGGAIAISTEYDARYAASSSMQMVLSLAVMRLGLTPEEAITAATINAAYAAGCGDVTGSLESEKRADVLVLNAPDYREVSRRFGINHVDVAIRGGSVVFNRTRWKASAP